MLITALQNTGFSFGQKTWYTSHHLGQDKKADYIPLEFPIDLFNCKYTNGKQGGLTVTGQDEAGYTHRFMHNSRFVIKNDIIEGGNTFAISGNSGSLTTKPHVHWDVRKPNTSSLTFANFVDPLEWEKNILPNLITMELPEWFKDNKTQEWAESTQIVTDWSDPFRSIPQYVMAEYLRKAVQKPTVHVNVFVNQFTLNDKEEKAYKLAVQECVKMYVPFCNLVFNKVEKKNLGILEYLSAGPAVRIKNWSAPKGLNVIITDDKDLANLSGKVQGGDLIGYMIGAQNTCLIRRSSLSVPDIWDRTTLSLFAGTLPHELCHWFADFLSTEDWTHKWDYEFTLTSYLTQLPFTQLNISANRIKLNLE